MQVANPNFPRSVVYFNPFTPVVLTPTDDWADRLHASCHSLLKQTLRKFEWLVVDDGSTADSDDSCTTDAFLNYREALQ